MTSKPSPPEAFLTTEEVLAYLQVNLRTVYRLIKTKSIPAVRGYDLVISDLNIPGMDGIALIREVKAGKANLPIIITGFSSEKSAIDAVNLRVAGYLTKPFRDTQVLEAAARALGASAA